MGYSYSGSIKRYSPDDTDTQFYIIKSASIGDILGRARKKWGSNISIDDIEITSEYIHTNCLTYDCYDSSDYTEYLVISYTK